jgi:hypothetical protein
VMDEDPITKVTHEHASGEVGEGATCGFPPDPVREHIAAAENYLAIAEGEFTKFYEEPSDDDNPGSYGKMQTSIRLADLHRKMAETCWNQPRVTTSVGETSDEVMAAIRERLEAKVAEPVDSCDCCASGLFNADGEAPSLCADCGHAGDRHNGNAPMKGGNVPVSEYSRGLDAEKARRDFAMPAGSALAWFPAGGAERSAWLAGLDGQQLSELRDALQAEVVRRSQRGASWKSPGGAGQWNG